MISFIESAAAFSDAWTLTVHVFLVNWPFFIYAQLPTDLHKEASGITEEGHLIS